MEWWKRLTMATRMFIQTYRYGALSPVENILSALSQAEWDSYESRLFRYLHYDLYYSNTVFSTLEAYRRQHLKERGLYKHTRGLYNPVFRLVELYANKCYGGLLDWTHLRSGAVPLVDADERIQAAVRNLWKWSNFGEKKVLYGRNGARYGDAVIKVVDEPDKGRVRLEFLHPGLIRDVEVDAVGYVKRVVIEYEKLDEETNQPFLYREVIDKERFATYRTKGSGEGDPYAVYVDADGNPVTEWDNPYGFVPLVLAKAVDLGRSWGAAPFFGGSLDKIDQANDLASLTVDQVRKTVNALWYFAGVSSMKSVQEVAAPATADEEQTLSNEERETMPALIGPAGSQPIPMVAPLNVDGALRDVEMLLEEIEKDLPELSLHRMREFAQHSAPAVLLVFGDAIDRITGVRGNLDGGLLRAFQMAITMGGIGGYPGFEPFGIEDYDKGNLDFRIGERPVVTDTLSKKERLDLYQATEAPPRWTWEELGVSEDQIARAEVDQFNQQRQVAGEVARVLATGAASSGNGGKVAQSEAIPPEEGGEGDEENA